MMPPLEETVTVTVPLPKGDGRALTWVAGGARAMVKTALAEALDVRGLPAKELHFVGAGLVDRGDAECLFVSWASTMK